MEHPIDINLPEKTLHPILIFARHFRDAGDLLVRWWIARIFFLSAMDKISSWDTTLVLFKYDYSVPFISSVWAAWIGTGFELILPIFLILGFGGRIMIFIFFMYNIVCVIAFHFLWTPAGTAGLDDHINWGLLMLMLLLHGPGRYSVDYLIHRKFGYILQVNATIKNMARKDQAKKVKD